MSFFKKLFRNILIKSDGNQNSGKHFTLSPFLTPKTRKILDKPITQWSTGDTMHMLMCFGIRNPLASGITDSMLKQMTQPKFFDDQIVLQEIRRKEAENLKLEEEEEEEEITNSSLMEDSNEKNLEFDVVDYFENKPFNMEKHERKWFCVFLQIIHNVVKIQKKEKLDFDYLFLVLKFQRCLTQMVKKGMLDIKQEEYRDLFRKNKFVDIDFFSQKIRLNITEENLGNNNVLPVSYIITDTAPQSDLWAKIQKNILIKLNLISLFGDFDYGVFHPCVVIGSTLLEWDNTSFVVCQDYDQSWSGSFAKAVFKVQNVNVTNEEKKNLVEDINRIIQKWNGKFVYDRSNHRINEGFANCHQFFNEIREALNKNLSNFRENKILQTILDKLKTKTELSIQQIYSFGLTDGFKKKLNEIDNLKKVFKALKYSTTHEEYDNLYKELRVNYMKKFQKDFPLDHPQDFQVLKAIDRAFWIKREKCISKLKKLESDGLRNHLKQQYKKNKGIDIDYEAKINCPFDDPIVSTLFKNEREDLGSLHKTPTSRSRKEYNKKNKIENKKFFDNKEDENEVRLSKEDEEKIRRIFSNESVDKESENDHSKEEEGGYLPSEIFENPIEKDDSESENLTI